MIQNINWLVVVLLVAVVVLSVNSNNKGKGIRKAKKELLENQQYLNDLAAENVALEVMLEEWQDSTLKYRVLLDAEIAKVAEQKAIFEKSLNRVNGRISSLYRKYEKDRQSLIQRIDSTLIFENQ